MIHSETPDIVPFPTTFRKKVLSESELRELRNGTLQLLDNVGVHFPSERALGIFADHGAEVDWDEERVRIPPDIVEQAMSKAPRSFVLGGREKRFDLILDGTHSYLCTSGTGVHVVDPDTGQMRPSRKEDVARMARVCDALPLVSFYWPPVSAQDYGPTAPLHQCHAGLTNTLKHVRGGMTVLPELAPYVVEMATAVAGGEQKLRKRPPICANICTISPLAHDGDGVETALAYAEAGIPVSFMAMTTMGSTAPATVLGALVQGDAEVISAMVLMQLAYPGTPVMHAVFVSLMDPMTGGYIGKPPVPAPIAAVQLAHSWGVPSLGGGNMSVESPVIDWELGGETGLAAGLIPVAGGEICGNMGLTGSAMILRPEKVVLDSELCWMARDMFRRIEFDVKDLALDVIKDVGPRGHFLAQQHTRRHIRDFRVSPVLRKEADGKRRDPREVALEEFRHLDATHHPQPLPEALQDELNRILRAADQAAEGLG